MAIRYIKHNDIDKQKWDECIAEAQNSMAYAKTWYLDIVCKNYDALIYGNYDAVMPLPWKQKYGLKYIYQPYLTQQLGVFFKPNTYVDVSDFLESIPKKFIKIDVMLNWLNDSDKLKLGKRINYTLSLNKSYSDLYSKFSKNTRRNIKKSNKNRLVIDELPVKEYIKISKRYAIFDYKPCDFINAENLFNYLTKNKIATILGVYAEDKKLIAGAVFMRYQNRITYLFSISSSEGKDKRAMFNLVNHIILEYAEQDILLDFEGSMIPSIARFFKSFGSEMETYYRFSKSVIPFI